MASYNEAEPLESTLSWNYSVRVPPYTLHDRVMPSWLTLDDLNDVGLSSLPYPILDDVLRSTPEERARTARRLRRIVLGVLFRNMYQHDERTWQECSEMFQSRLVELGDFEDGSEWVADTVQRFLRDKEKVRLPSTPVHETKTH